MFSRDIESHDAAPQLVETLQLQEKPTPLSSATQQSFSASSMELQHDVTSKLTSVRSTYLTALTALTQDLRQIKVSGVGERV